MFPGFQRIASACKPFDQEAPHVSLVQEPEINLPKLKSPRRPSILPMNWSTAVEAAPEEKILQVPITLSLIQGLDRETDL